ncbi:MAG: DUF4232 domain-containing protein, partial [Actinomycetota bacterium]|nr:DUF4232 domain-containing protein [Actinomycetota bacterium]
MDDEIRELLRRKADEVPPHGDVPRSLTRRVRRRVAWNAAAVGTMLVVLGAGTVVGARALNAPGSPKPIRPASTATVQSSPSPSSTACTSQQLRAVGSLEGAMGSRDGTISLTNMSDLTCTLQGNPTITLLDKNLNPITSGVTFSSAPAGWAVNASPTPPGWPLLTLAPAEAASVRIRWGNWCPDGRSSPLWRIDAPGGGTIDVSGFDVAGPPPC